MYTTIFKYVHLLINNVFYQFTINRSSLEIICLPYILLRSYWWNRIFLTNCILVSRSFQMYHNRRNSCVILLLVIILEILFHRARIQLMLQVRARCDDLICISSLPRNLVFSDVALLINIRVRFCCTFNVDILQTVYVLASLRFHSDIS